jgi:hypothetical protein
LERMKETCHCNPTEVEIEIRMSSFRASLVAYSFSAQKESYNRRIPNTTYRSASYDAENQFFPSVSLTVREQQCTTHIKSARGTMLHA